MLSEKLRSRGFWKFACPILLVVLTLLFGTIGFRLHHPPDQPMIRWGEAFMNAAGLPILETTNDINPEYAHWTLHVGRILGIVIPPYAFILVLMAAFRTPYNQFKVTCWRWLPWVNHAVVCGLGWKGFELVGDLRQNGWKVAVIEPKPDNPFADDITDRNVVIFNDDATSQAVLRVARVAHAGRIYVVSGNDELNCRIVNQLVVVVPKRQPPLTWYVDAASRPQRLARWATEIANFCVTHFRLEPTVARNLLERAIGHESCLRAIPPNPGHDRSRTTHLVHMAPKTGSPPECYVDVVDRSLRHYLAQWATKIGKFPLTCFNLEESTARGVLRRHRIDRFTPDDTRDVAHVAIVGSSPMARALLVQSLRIGHLQPDRSLEIDLLMENAPAYQEALCREMPCLHPDWGTPGSVERRVRDYALPRIILTELPDSDSELLDDECRIYHGLRDDHVPSLFVCIDDGYESAALVGRIMDKLEHLCAGTETDLHVGCYYNYPEDPEKELTKVLDERSGDCVTFFDFGSYDEECTVETVEGRHLDALARQIALFYETEYGEGPPRGATDQQKAAHFERVWDESKEWEKESNRQAADHLHVKLRSVGVNPEEAKRPGFQFDEHQKEQLARMEHKRWCAERLLSGWRPLPDTDAKKRQWADKKGQKALKAQKLHADLVPFDDLPPGEKDKDYGQIEDIPRALREAAQHRPK